jgi:CSLREA domain-containing protein
MLIGIQAGTHGPPAAAQEDAFLVNKAEDHDDGTCTSADCTLREAILAANADPGPNLIKFDLPGAGLHPILLTSRLPIISNDGSVIDGTTQPDYRDSPTVVLVGNAAPPVSVGLHIDASDCTIRGLAFLQFQDDGSGVVGAVHIAGGAGNRIEHNTIGLSLGRETNWRGNLVGVWLAGRGQLVLNNIIAENGYGVWVAQETGEHLIQGNYIGTDASGRVARPNVRGLWLDTAAFDVRIGGPGAAEGNLISGNSRFGIVAMGFGHVIQGNRIGTDIDGNSPLPNWQGILVAAGSDAYQIGGTEPGEGNLISGNGDFGLYLSDGRHVVQGNRIGVDATGSRALPNTDGIVLGTSDDDDAEEVLVGGPLGSGAGNVISGNTYQGISLVSSRNWIQGNLIGTDASGMRSIPNGVGIGTGHEAEDNWIGGPDPSFGNLISGNERGVVLRTSANQLSYNQIGTNLNATASLGNGIGIQIFGDSNRIEHNLISGNGHGIAIESGHDNQISNNRIGTDESGAAGIPNQIGISVGSGYDLEVSKLLLGGAGAGNGISGNAQCGLLVSEGPTDILVIENTIQENGFAPGAECAGEGVSLHGTTLEVARVSLRRNSLSQNTGLGIAFVGGMVNRSILPPMLEVANLTEARGSGCPGCLIELFVADEDSGGAGEGMTYLGEATAGPDGAFQIALPTGLSHCTPLTATATDPDGNTSEFARNLRASCLVIDWPIAGLVVIALGAVGALVGGRLFPRRQRPGAGPAGGAAVGLAAGLLLAAAANSLPGMRVDLTPHLPEGLQAALQIDDRPIDGTQGLDNLPTSVAGTPNATDEPLGESQGRDLAPETAPFLTTPALIPASTLTPTLAPPLALARQNAFCRYGPSQVYEPSAMLNQGQSAPIQGRNDDDTWWFVLPGGERYGCWVWAGAVEATGDLSGVPRRQAPPTPTSTPVQGCWVYNQQQQKVCVAPCPANGNPADACTP